MVGGVGVAGTTAEVGICMECRLHGLGCRGKSCTSSLYSLELFTLELG